MSRISKDKSPQMPPVKWTALPLEKLHPFAQSVRLVMDSATRFADFLLENNEDEIARELSAERSCFMYNLKILLKTENRPDKTTLAILTELKNCLELLKKALKKHFTFKNSRVAIAEINKLIKEICDHHNFEDYQLKKDIYVSCCNQLMTLNTISSSPSEAHDAINATISSCSENSTANSLARIADKESSMKSKLISTLQELKKIIEHACANSKDGDFLFKREDYISVVNTLWQNQTSENYAVHPADAADISSLWLEIRHKLIKYAKCMIPKPYKLIRDLENERCWILFPKFTTIGELPHVLDLGTVKELFATLKIEETPRKAIKHKAPQEPKGKNTPTENVDIDELPKKDYRFAMSKDYRNIVDTEHRDPPCKIDAYLGMPPNAASIAKKLISCANRKKTEGWHRPENKWHVSFQKGVAKRFKNEQIEIKRHRDGLSYWRIIPTEAFIHHYNCNLKPLAKSF